MDKKFTARGFGYYELPLYQLGREETFTIQKSSNAMEDRIWIGAADLHVKRFKAYKGWENVNYIDTTEEQYAGNNRLELNQEQVKQLIPILQRFVDTGEV